MSTYKSNQGYIKSIKLHEKYIKGHDHVIFVQTQKLG